MNLWDTYIHSETGFGIRASIFNDHKWLCLKLMLRFGYLNVSENNNIKDYNIANNYNALFSEKAFRDIVVLSRKTISFGTVTIFHLVIISKLYNIFNFFKAVCIDMVDVVLK